jgi:hypothetical protein
VFKPLLVAVIAFPLLLAARVAEPAYQAANVRISTDYRADKAACASLPAARRDVCYENAGARRKVARAELEHGNGGRARDQHKVMEARAEAAYAVARARCSGLQGGLKDLCLQQAQSAEAQALADARRALPLAVPRAEGARVQRVAVDTSRPAATFFKAVAK